MKCVLVDSVGFLTVTATSSYFPCDCVLITFIYQIEIYYAIVY